MSDQAFRLLTTKKYYEFNLDKAEWIAGTVRNLLMAAILHARDRNPLNLTKDQVVDDLYVAANTVRQEYLQGPISLPPLVLDCKDMSAQVHSKLTRVQSECGWINAIQGTAYCHVALCVHFRNATEEGYAISDLSAQYIKPAIIWVTLPQSHVETFYNVRVTATATPTNEWEIKRTITRGMYNICKLYVR